MAGRSLRSPLVVALWSAAVAWVAGVATTWALVGQFDLLTERGVVVFGAVTAAAPALLAVACVGTWAGTDHDARGMDRLTAAVLGALGYLVLGAVLLAPGGGVRVAAAALLGGVAGIGVGAGVALVLRSR